uniref:Uncharacterized protein n=1 Tax=Glossina brevipalpis TaxID=37001 RepID=A0A1A9WB06_9MUSC
MKNKWEKQKQNNLIMSASAGRSVSLLTRAWNEIPDIVAGSVLALIGVGLGVIGLANYYSHDGDNRRFKLTYVVMRPDDPKAAKCKFNAFSVKNVLPHKGHNSVTSIVGDKLVVESVFPTITSSFTETVYSTVDFFPKSSYISPSGATVISCILLMFSFSCNSS